MRLFLSSGFGFNYLHNFRKKNQLLKDMSFSEQKQSLLNDRYNATHILKPIYDNDPDCFFTVCDDLTLQNKWAEENSLRSRNPTDILLAQIEESRSEIVYQHDPIKFPSSFIKKLPSCVRKTIAWRAAPCGIADLSAYDVVLSNFESLNQAHREKGWRAAWFAPSWDPEMLPYAQNVQRPVDIFFTGSYSRTTGHDERLDLLNSMAGIGGQYHIDLRLMYRKWGRLADSAPWRWIPTPIFLPPNLRGLSGKPVFARDMYLALSQAKIVINPATTIAGDIRGNMRCWEALGCGACLLGSEGQYPEGFQAGTNFETFKDKNDLVKKSKDLLYDDSLRISIATAGTHMLRQVWSKDRQWQDFKSIVSTL